MNRRIPFWLREWFKMLLQYLGAGLASIPAGILYALLLTYGVKQGLALGVSVVIGLCMAYFAWEVIGRRIPLERALTEVPLQIAKSVFVQPSLMIGSQDLKEIITGSNPREQEGYSDLVRQMFGGESSRHSSSRQAISHAFGGGR